MPERSTMASALLCLGALGALGGCGGAAESSQPEQSAAAKAPEGDKKHQFEAAKADCMKSKGFKYVAYVPPEKQKSDEEIKRASGDYQAMQKYRGKFGFGVFAEFVYPKEMGGGAEPEANPNVGIQNKLSGAQGASYRKASDACMIVAAKRALGKDLKPGDDFYAQMNRASERAMAAVDSDPELIELAATMAGCLKEKGYPVGKTTPTAMSNRGLFAFLDLSDKLGRKQRDLPEVAPPVKDGQLKMTYQPDLSAAEAKPYLDREIKAALDDLECGKDFYAVISPKEEAVNRQIFDEFGM
ncbi:hypothetical protein [Microtetraspora malaysiensis]|uniref:hypothetical protein n=1 Tax=Microtetraspora malaysiensis TaxID=161358 RepID=UPI003D930A96